MTELTWDSAAEWDAAVSESGVVHESVTNTDHNDAGSVKRGYKITNPYLSSSLSSYWPLHEDSGGTAYDFGGSNNGSVNGPTQSATGLLGTTAYSFDGIDDYISLSDYSFSFANGVTLSMWVNLTNDGNAHRNEFTDADSSWIWEVRGGGTVRFLHRSTSSLSVASGSQIPFGEWKFLLFVYDSSTYEIYIDGVLDTSKSDGSNVDNSQNSTTIGKDASNNAHINGTVADVRVYNRALSSSEIQHLYDVVNTNGSLITSEKVS